MTNENSIDASKKRQLTLQRAHFIYAVCLSIVIVITGICFIAACIGIYNSGNKQPFTSESVATAFASISIPVYICTVMTIGGIIFDIISKTDSAKSRPSKPYATMLKKAYTTRTFSECDDVVRSQITKEQNSRKIHSIIRTVLFCTASIVFLAYGTNSDNFHQVEITNSMINAMFVLLPCLIVCFAYGLFTVIYCEKSMERELALVKSLPTATSIPDSIEATKDKNTTYSKLILFVRIALLIFGVIILIYGYMTGGTMDVLTKAINICTECIGLG